MKSKIGLFLAIVMSILVTGSPVAYAQECFVRFEEQTTMVDVAVVDAEGNLIGNVKMSEASRRSLAAGAYFTFKGIKALVYTGYYWVCTHPTETLQSLEFLINLFDLLQIDLGQLLWADYDGEEFVSAQKVSGESCIRVKGSDRWQCLYSV